MITTPLTLADLERYQAKLYGEYLPFRESDMALYAGLYDKSLFDSFVDFGVFCCRTHTIQKQWYRSGDTPAVFQTYAEKKTNYEERFKAWMAAADDPDNTSLRHSKKDAVTSLRIIFGSCFVPWLEPGLISESYYNRGGRSLTFKGIGEKYFIDVFFTKIHAKTAHANFLGLK